MSMVLGSPINVGHIDDVQELRKSGQTVIPDRFVRDIDERPTVPANGGTLNDPSGEVPVVDFSKLANGNGLEINSEILKLAEACQEWGFFQVVNHGIDLNLVDGLEKAAKDFFALPLEEKKKHSMVPGIVQGYGQAFVFSEDQKLDWCNMLALIIEPRNLRIPKFWPERPVQLGEIMEAYSTEVRRLCQNLLKYIELSLGLRGNTFEDMFGHALQAVRMNYYPACPRPDLVFGLSPHSDGSALTVLQQGKGDPVGLQILKDDKWISVQPRPNALVINVGDTIEVLTNGKYKSVEHRAVTHKEKDRLSVVTFYAPSHDVELGPMEELVNESNPCRYRRYNHGEYSKHYLTNKLQGKKTLEFAKIPGSNSN